LILRQPEPRICTVPACAAALRGGCPLSQIGSQLAWRMVCVRDETVDGGLEIDHAPEDEGTKR